MGYGESMRIIDLKKSPVGIALSVLCFAVAITPVALGQSSNTEDVVLLRAKGGEHKAILELGKVEHLSATSLAELKNMAQEDNKAYGSAAVSARMVLAKHGDKKCFDEVKEELLHGTPYEQVNALEKLAYVGGAESIRLIAPFLDRDDQPVERGPKDKVFFPPYSKLAVVALGRIVDQPPSTPPDVKAVNQHDVDLWRQWWKANKSKYGNEELPPRASKAAPHGQ
jgi:hypothetical protein